MRKYLVLALIFAVALATVFPIATKFAKSGLPTPDLVAIGAIFGLLYFVISLGCERLFRIELWRWNRRQQPDEMVVLGVIGLAFVLFYTYKVIIPLTNYYPLFPGDLLMNRKDMVIYTQVDAMFLCSAILNFVRAIRQYRRQAVQPALSE